jgi:signal transduction histidine kinase
MDVDAGVAVPLLGWLAGGLAAVALTPRNRTAQALLAAGVLLVGSWLCEGAATRIDGTTTSGALVRVVTDVLFLGGLASVVVVLCTYPDGRFDRSWMRVVTWVLAVLAVLAPVAQLVGSPELLIGAEPSTAAPNPLAIDALAAIGAAGKVVVASEPAWLVLGVGILCARFVRSSGARRRELLRPLAGAGLLAVLLLMVVVSWVTDTAVAVSEPVFLLALALFPVVLLGGISVQSRQLAGNLAASRGRLAAAEDEVRRSIERDLHDGVQQQLMALLSLTELAGRQLQRDPAQAANTLADVRSQARDTVEDLRELVSGIRPPVLADSGVAAALESRLARLPDTVQVDADAARVMRWPAGIEAAAYFVACEGVTNALKHAPGARVRVTLHGDPDQLIVGVRDDGPGIGVTSTGTGLAGLRDRVDSWGGTFEVRAIAPRGTLVRARLPVGAIR